MRYLISALILAGVTLLGSVSLAQDATLQDGTKLAEGQQAKSGEKKYRLRIGVRSQARPFSYKSDTLADVLTAATPGPLARAEYTGFMVKVCDAVLTDLILNPPDPDNPITSNDIGVVDVDQLLIDAASEQLEIERHQSKVKRLRREISELKDSMKYRAAQKEKELEEALASKEIINALSLEKDAQEKVVTALRSMSRDVRNIVDELKDDEGINMAIMELGDKDLNFPAVPQEANQSSIEGLNSSVQTLEQQVDQVNGLIDETFEKLKGNSVAEGAAARSMGSRFRYLNPVESQGPRLIDILCDPASITNERRDGLMISPPVYMTGISFITPPISRHRQSNRCPTPHSENDDRAQFLFGLVGNTTAASAGIRALLAANELPADREALIQFLRRGDDSVDTCSINEVMQGKIENTTRHFNARWSGGPVLIFTSHDQAARAFCDGYVHYYLGDRDIIVEMARTIPGCEFDNGTRTFTSDRYGIFGKLDYSDPDQSQLVSRFFEILSQKVLSHPSILDQAFYETFYPNEATRTLKYFFRSIRGMPPSDRR